MTEEYVPPLGNRFSQLYLERGEALEDSLRMRRRVVAVFQQDVNRQNVRIDFAGYFKRRLGIEVPFNGNSYNFSKFFEECDIKDFLDLIALVADGLREDQYIQTPIISKWFNEVGAIFVEENVCYRIIGGQVEPFIDQVFQRNQKSLLSALEISRLSAVRAEVENAYHNLRSERVDTKTAVRSMYDGIESYLKLEFDFASLGPPIIKSEVHSRLKQHYSEDEIAVKSIAQLVEGFCKWVVAMQQYRHGQGTNEPSPPPIDLAILLVDQGASFLRWLLDSLECDANIEENN